MSFQSDLRIFNLTPPIERSMLKASYHNLCQLSHPGGDVNGFMQINEAYKRLLADCDKQVCSKCNGKKTIDFRGFGFTSLKQPCPECTSTK
jgi:hypothetical protein